MQEKSHNQSQIYSRIEKLRVVRDLSWDETASLLDCNRSYFFHLKAGRKDPSVKFIYKLEEAEKVAGIRKVEPVQPLEHPPDKKSNEWKLKASSPDYGSQPDEDMATRLERIEKKLDHITELLKRRKS